jgi:hypothetical protein
MVMSTVTTREQHCQQCQTTVPTPTVPTPTVPTTTVLVYLCVVGDFKADGPIGIAIRQGQQICPTDVVVAVKGLQRSTKEVQKKYKRSTKEVQKKYKSTENN